MTVRPGRILLWLLVVGLIALTLAADCARVARADMAFLLYAAGQVLDGAELYRDVVEINPPLIIWLNLPIVALARAAGVSELRLYTVASAGVLTLLLLNAARLARRYALRAQPQLRAWFVLAAAVALFPLARADFGQREHLALGLLVAYLLLIVARLRSVSVPSIEAALVGLLAAVGFALKPHLILVWVALELLRYWRAPQPRTLATPEAATVALALGLYLLAVRAFTPAYLEVVGLLGPAYSRYLQAPFLEVMLLSPGAALALFAGLALVALRRRLPDPAVSGTLGVAMLGGLVAAATQQKGLRYHFYPAFALAFVLVALLATRVRWVALRPTERIYAAVARALALAVAMVAVGGTIVTLAGGRPAERQARAQLFELVDLVKSRAGGRPVGVLSYHMESAFPLVSYAGVRLASRLPHLWILPASYWDSLAAGAAVRYHEVGEMADAERWLNHAVREDLLAADPRVLIVLRPARDVGANGPRRMHYIRYFSRQPELAALFARYRLVRQVGEFDVYEQYEGAPGTSAPRPSTAPAQLDVKGADGSGIRLAFSDPEFSAGLGIFLLVLGLTLMPDRRRVDGAPSPTVDLPAADSTG